MQTKYSRFLYTVGYGRKSTVSEAQSALARSPEEKVVSNDLGEVPKAA